MEQKIRKIPDNSDLEGVEEHEISRRFKTADKTN